MNERSIAVHGLGYIGLVHAGALAALGWRVVGVDIDHAKRAAFARGESLISEHGLAPLLRAAHEEGALCAVASAAEAVRLADVHIICIGTPPDADGRADLSALERACGDLGRALTGRDGALVILRSTIPPGTSRRVAAIISEHAGTPVAVAFAPEMLREGQALADLAQPALLAIAATDDATSARALAALPVSDEARAAACRVDFETAELLKYACNAWHATKVAFANEMGTLASAFGVSGVALMRLLAADRVANISPRYLRPGAAFGGACLPKDVAALALLGADRGLSLPLTASLLPSNDRHLDRLVAHVVARAETRVGLIGLAFKGGTDDLRESPALRLMAALVARGKDVRAWDPAIDPSRLHGANREAASRIAPDFAERLVEREALFAWAEVIVVHHGASDADIARWQVTHPIIDVR